MTNFTKDDVVKFLQSNNIKNLYKKDNLELLLYVVSITPQLNKDAPLQQRIYHIIHGNNIPNCAECDSIVKWDRQLKKYRMYCSSACSNKSTLTKTKFKKTCQSKYGASHHLKNKSIIEKQRQTFIDKYGVDRPAKNPEIIKQMERTNLQKYGVKNYSNTDEYHTKVKITNRKRFGKDYYTQTTEWKDRTDKTNTEKYGYTRPSKNKDIINKTRLANLSKYGVDSPAKLPSTKKKAEQTNLDKYGNIHFRKTAKYEEAIKNKFDKLGRHYQQEHMSDDTIKILNSPNDLRDMHIKDHMSLLRISKHLSVSPRTIRNYFKKYSIPLTYFNSSDMEQDLLSSIRSIYDNTILVSDRSLLSPYELDVYLPDLKLAFEFDGLYWHSDLVGKDKNYHLNKTKLCNDKNIRLVHIFENEWVMKQDIVKSRISNLLGKSEKIYARKCNVVILNNSDKLSFLNSNHIQGNCPSSVNLGLEYNNTLVAVMTFGKSRFSKKYEWELLRYTNVLNTLVVGGASKLFTYFIKNHNPVSVISYSDRRWNTGNLYTNLGFSFLKSSPPNFFYFNNKDYYVLRSRLEFQKHKLATKLESFDPNLSEWENMVNNGWNRIWDCGNDVFVWKKN